MGFVWSTARKDWIRRMRDPVALLLWIGIPIFIGGILTAMSGGRSGPKPQAHVLVADLDDSFLSGLLIGAMSQDAMGELIRAEEVEEAAGREQVADGKATALLIIPDGFGMAVLQETPTTLTLLTNPAQTVLPGIVEETLSMLVDATFYLHRLVGNDLRRFATGPPGDDQIASFSVQVNGLVERVGTYLNPLAIQLEEVKPAVEDEDSGPDQPVALLFLPSILFMALLFMAQGLSHDIWEEKEKHTLERVITSPQSPAAFLTGKLLAGAGIIFLVCLIAMVIGYIYFDLTPSTLPVAVVWATFSGVFLAVGLLVLQVFASNPRGAGVMSLVVIFPLMMLGGSFFPFEAMPSWMAGVGRLTPNGWALEQLKRILFNTVEPGTMLMAFVGMIMVGGVLFAIAVWRVRTRFIQA